MMVELEGKFVFFLIFVKNYVVFLYAKLWFMNLLNFMLRYDDNDDESLCLFLWIMWQNGGFYRIIGVYFSVGFIDG